MMDKILPHRDYTENDTPQELRPQSHSMSLIQGNPVINLHNSIASLSGFVLLLFSFVFSPCMPQLLAEVCTSLLHSNTEMTLSSELLQYVCKLPQISICSVLRKINTTETKLDNIILGQYVAFWVTFLNSSC